MSGFNAAKLPQCDVLAFGPHPDDVEIGCGGTLLLMKQAGMKVAIVDCTRGEMGSRGTAADRDAEAEAAAAALGLDARANLGLKDTGIRDDDDATDLVVGAIRAARPPSKYAVKSGSPSPFRSSRCSTTSPAALVTTQTSVRPSPLVSCSCVRRPAASTAVTVSKVPS